jgi:hypothetical protein
MSSPKTDCICKFCNKSFTRKDSFNRHEKTCKSKMLFKIEEKDELIKKMENELIEKNKEIEKKNDQIEFLKSLLVSNKLI